LHGIGETNIVTDDSLKFDENITPHLINTLNDPAPKKFIILHLAGSHPSQKMRYPKVFDRLRNAYDNSILYTDHLVNQWRNLIEEASGSESVAVIYLSDHGVKLPPGCGLGELIDNDYKPYAADDRFASSVEIPLFIWFNKAFREKNRSLFLNTADHSHSPIDHTFFIPSISSLMGFKKIQGYDLVKKNIFQSEKINFTPRLNIEFGDIDLRYKSNKICVH
jgi:glucan phosphoethanolaminetransferase (alkaline phosphatase superfamily)